MTYNTLKHGEHTFRDVILVTLGFHMCGHCISMLSPFFSGLKNDKYASGESSLSELLVGRTDLRPKRPDNHLPSSWGKSPAPTLNDNPDMYRAREELRQRLDLHCHVKKTTFTRDPLLHHTVLLHKAAQEPCTT